jgi:hypothetical protein
MKASVNYVGRVRWAYGRIGKHTSDKNIAAPSYLPMWYQNNGSNAQVPGLILSTEKAS